MKRDAKEFWAKPLSTVSQKSECTIVVTAAHTDTMQVGVENNRRCNDDVELPGRNNKSACWFPDAHFVLCEFRVFEYFAKDHLSLLAQNRYENALVCAPGSFDDFTCIDLVVGRQVTADQPAGVKLARRDDLPADSSRRASTFPGTHRATGLQRVTSK